MNDDKQLELPIPATRPRVRLQDNELPSERTEWMASINPPMPGWWEVINWTQSNASMWWWDSTQWIKPATDTKPKLVMTTIEFHMFSHMWRGLKEPSDDVYPCPPYDTTALMTAASESGVALRTMYAIITKRPRKRVHLDNVKE